MTSRWPGADASARPPQIGVIGPSSGYAALVQQHHLNLGLPPARFFLVSGDPPLDWGPALRRLKADAQVQALAAFLETDDDVQQLRGASATITIPVVACMVGNIQGAMCEAALRQSGIVCTTGLEELLDVATALAAHAGQTLPAGNRVAVVSSSHALVLLARDACASADLAIAESEAQADGVIILSSPDDQQPPNRGEGHKALPTVRCQVGGASDATAVTYPGYPTPERAVRAYRGLRECAQLQAKRAATTARKPDWPTAMIIEGAGVMDEYETKRLLDRWGIPVVPETLITGPGRHEFVPIRKVATHFHFPVVLKAVQADLVNKSAVGAVAVGLGSIEELRQAWEQMHQRFPDAAWLIQPYLPGDIEVVVLARRDHVLGPVITFGTGGVFTELYGDIALGVAPLSVQDAVEMIARTKASALMQGFRGLPRHDPLPLARLVVRVGELMLGQPSVQEMDVNPVLLTEQGPVVVDANATIG